MPATGSRGSAAGAAGGLGRSSRSAGRGSACRRCARCSTRYPVPLIIELKTPEPALARAHGRRGARRRRRRARGARLVLLRGCCTRRARYEPRIATGAAREETRWALYRSWVRWPLGRHGVPRVPGAGTIGPDDDRHAAVRRPRAPRRAAGEGLDGQRRARTSSGCCDWGVDAIISDRPDVAVARGPRGLCRAELRQPAAALTLRARPSG